MHTVICVLLVRTEDILPGCNNLGKSRTIRKLLWPRKWAIPTSGMESIQFLGNAKPTYRLSVSSTFCNFPRIVTNRCRGTGPVACKFYCFLSRGTHGMEMGHMFLTFLVISFNICPLPVLHGNDSRKKRQHSRFHSTRIILLVDSQSEAPRKSFQTVDLNFSSNPK